MLSLKNSKILLFICLFISFNRLFAQDTYLDKAVTLTATNQSYEYIFAQISKQTGVVFSYTSFNNQQKTTYSCSKKTLEKVLHELLENKCTYKTRGKYIILTEIKPKYVPKEKISIQGKIIDAETLKPIPDVSIYITANKYATVSDTNGNFSFTLTKTRAGFVLSIAKENYADTSLWLEEKNKTGIIIALRRQKVQQLEEVSVSTKDSVLPEQDSLLESIRQIKLDSILKHYTEEGRKIWRKLKSRNSNFRNIRDTLFSAVSFSLIPPLSTNHLLSLNTVNLFSFNLLVGQSKGVELFELGGLANIDAGNVRYAQIAGVTNVVKGNVEGFQMAGITNLNGGSMEGAQIGGIFNSNGGFFDGFQLAGIANLNLSHGNGMQIAGISNINRGNFNGYQLSGISNQVFGKMYGTQITGVYNSADTIYGFQLSGLVNRAREMYGTQLALINFAGNHHGIPIGLLSFVKKGHHKLEFAYDDLQFGTAAFRTGVDRFHNILFAGISLRDYPNTRTFGYGLGSSFKLSKRWYFNMDLTAQTIRQNNTSWDGIQALGKFFTGLEYRPIKKINLVAGPTFNAFVTNKQEWQPTSIVSNNLLYDESFPAVDLKMWIGMKVAIRFF